MLGDPEEEKKVGNTEGNEIRGTRVWKSSEMLVSLL